MNEDRCTTSAPERFDISTATLPAAQRFNFYCDLITANYLSFADAGAPETGFAGHMSAAAAGAALITRNVTTAAHWGRSRRSTGIDGDFVMLSLLETGTARIRQADADLAMRPGSVALFPTSMPSRVDILTPAQSLTVRLPRAAIETAVRPGQLIQPLLFAPDDPAIVLAGGYIRSYLQSGAGLGPAGGPLASRHLADLVALALGAHRDSHAAAAGGLKAARTDAVLRAIARNYASPQISAVSVGAALDISDRHVHRLLEETNRTFYEHLLEARLGAAWRLLRDPAMRQHRIGEIAMLAGFQDVTHFNRAFKARFGDTPSGVRATIHWG